jgi:hypothetical protein
MILDHNIARRFIDTYRRLLLVIDADLYGINSTVPLLEKLQRARKKLVMEPSLMKRYLARASQDDEYGKSMLTAIETLKLESWVYLRDTRSYSIFILADGSAAFGVLGLTDRIRDVVGGSGVFFEAGVIEINGHYVCDGLIAGVVLLGKGYMQSYTKTLTSLRQQGHFHKQVAQSVPSVHTDQLQ